MQSTDLIWTEFTDTFPCPTISAKGEANKTMDWLNYHHLFYFWTVAKEGSIARASDKLHLTQATISAQLRSFEANLGEKLFNRVGRKLILTETGRVALRYAEEIFTLGREFMDTLKGRPTGQPMRFRVGIADVLPKLIALRLLEPAFTLLKPFKSSATKAKPMPC